MAKQKRSRSAEDYIEGENKKKQSGSRDKVLIVAAGAIIIVVFAVVAILLNSMIKEPELTEEGVPDEVTADMGDGYFDEFGNWVSLTPKPITGPTIVVRPSDEIINAELLSGQFQLGEYLFQLPCKLSAFTDIGAEIYLINERDEAKLGYAFLEHTLSPGTNHEIIICYKDTYLHLYTFDSPEDGSSTPLLDATVTTVIQDSEYEMYSEKSSHIYIPGGVCIGVTEADADAVYQDDVLLSASVKTHSKLYVYNGPERYPFHYNNLVSFWINKADGLVSYVKVYKNY